MILSDITKLQPVRIQDMPEELTSCKNVSEENLERALGYRNGKIFYLYVPSQYGFPGRVGILNLYKETLSHEDVEGEDKQRYRID